jgi:hypothetical protein
MARITIIDDDTMSIICLVLFFVWIFTDVARLYTGYYGNIKESFPEMLTFVVISIIAMGLLFVNLFLPWTFALENVIIIVNLIFTFLGLIWE